MQSDGCVPLWKSLNCTTPPTGETCLGFNVTTTNPEEITAALISRGIVEEVAAGLATQVINMLVVYQYYYLMSNIQIIISWLDKLNVLIMDYYRVYVKLVVG
jgi:hypothetical protein